MMLLVVKVEPRDWQWMSGCVVVVVMVVDDVDAWDWMM